MNACAESRLEAAPVLPDLLRTGLDLVICGTAAGDRSAQAKAYYAGPGNKFWRILDETGLTPRRLAPAEFRRLPEFGIGLTDLAKHSSGRDAQIRPHDYDPAAVRRKIKAAAPRVLAFNSKKAAKVFFGANTVDYGRRPERIGNTVLFVLPSTSGRASKWWNAAVWRELAALVRHLRAALPYCAPAAPNAPPSNSTNS